MPSRTAFVWMLVLLAGLPGMALGQGSDSRRVEINAIRFEGNDTFSNAELRSQLVTRETPGWLNKFLYRSISEKLGRPDEFLNAITLAADREKLRKYYENRGFIDAAVDTVLQFSDDTAEVNITFRVHEGYRSIIDTLAYRGIPPAPETIEQDLRNGPRIARGDPFNSLMLEEEVKRVLDIFNNNGFPYAEFVRDSSSATRFASSRNFSVVMSFHPGKRYRFGDVTVEQELDSTKGVVQRREDITDDIVLRHLDYKPGEFYSKQAVTNSDRNLNRLGVFDLRRITPAIPSQSDTAIMIPTHVVIRPRDKHELAPELIASNENEAFNLGAGLGYNNRNFLGGARIFSTHVRFRTQTLGEFPRYFARDNDAVSNFDITLELLQPYIFTNKVKGTWSFSYIIDKQKPYKLDIFRNRFGINDRLADYTTGQLDWILESVSIITRELPPSSLDPEMKRQLDLLPQRQFNSVLSFSMQRDKTNDIFSPTEGFAQSLTLQEAGLLPLALRWVNPELYTQFYSISMLERWYSDLNGGKRFSVLAMKLKGGFEEKYGESRSDPNRQIPQMYRFYAGGSGSVRGWNSRELIARGEPQLGGNLAFEGSVEWRVNLLQNLHDGLFDKIWVVQFMDFGNLWPTVRDFRIKDIAVAAGIGFRYDTFFGPFRIDWGFRVYNPAEQPGQQWITQRRLLGQTFKEGVFHFGIGHAF